MRVEVDTSHSWFGGVRSSQQRRVLRCDFGQVCRSVAETCHKGGEGVEMVAKLLIDFDPPGGAPVEG